MSRWVIEGTWSGYTSSQSRVAHREVTTRRAFAEAVEKLGFIRYTDGTFLYLQVRPAKPREKVVEQQGYRSLIRDCISAGVNSVDALYASREATQ